MCAMSSINPIALSGIGAATRQMSIASRNIATDLGYGAKPGTALVDDMAKLGSAKRELTANLRVLHVDDEMSAKLLDIKA